MTPRRVRVEIGYRLPDEETLRGLAELGALLEPSLQVPPPEQDPLTQARVEKARLWLRRLQEKIVEHDHYVEKRRFDWWAVWMWRHRYSELRYPSRQESLPGDLPTG